MRLPSVNSLSQSLRQIMPAVGPVGRVAPARRATTERRNVPDGEPPLIAELPDEPPDHPTPRGTYLNKVV